MLIAKLSDFSKICKKLISTLSINLGCVFRASILINNLEPTHFYFILQLNEYGKLKATKKNSKERRRLLEYLHFKNNITKINRGMYIYCNNNALGWNEISIILNNSTAPFSQSQWQTSKTIATSWAEIFNGKYVIFFRNVSKAKNYFIKEEKPEFLYQYEQFENTLRWCVMAVPEV